jgi:hypothetical protein
VQLKHRLVMFTMVYGLMLINLIMALFSALYGIYVCLERFWPYLLVQG